MSESGHQKRNLIFSIIILVFIVTLVSAALMLAIFRQNIANEYETLRSMSETESGFISNLCQNEKINPGKDFTKFTELLNKNDKYFTSGTTGDTLIARRSGNEFRFLYSVRNGDIASVQNSTLDNLFENGTIRIILFGDSPIFIGEDFKGNTVLSVFVPIKDTELLLIVKKDLSEVMIPFSKLIVKFFILEFILLIIGITLIVFIYIKAIDEKIQKALVELSESNRRVKELQKIEKSLEFMKNDMEEALEVGLFGFWLYNFGSGTSIRSLRHDYIFGYDAIYMDWTFQTFINHVVEEDREEVKKHFDLANTSSEELDIACRINKRDGELRWLWIRGRKRRDDGSLIGIVRDITGRKKAEKELADIRNHLKELVEAKIKEIETEKESLKTALANVKTLKSLLPICSGCKQVRDDDGYWSKVETYIQKHTGTEFSHGLCPDCVKKHYPELAALPSEGKQSDDKDKIG